MEIDTLIYAPTSSAVRALRKAFLGTLFTTQPPLADSISWARHENIALIGPAIGAPAAVLACEPFLSRGARRLVLFGVCGGLSFGEGALAIGDVVLPSAAIREDGTSALYGAPEEFSIPASFLTEVLPHSHSCPVWTTDAPLRENSDKAKMFFERGARAVEMELTALAWLAREQEAEFAACFVVSDLLGDITRREFKGARVQESLQTTAEAVAGAVREIPTGEAAPVPIELNP